MADIAELGFKIDSREADRATASLDKMTGAAKRAETGTERMARQMQGEMQRLNSMLRGTAGLFAGYFSFQAAMRFAGGLTRIADEYTSIVSKLRLVTQGNDQLRNVTAQVYAISQRTLASMDATATLASRTTRALVSSGMEQNAAMQQSLLLTEAVNNAFRVSGATGVEAANAIRQLSQGIASGVLRGEEYNSVAEQGARITQALGEYLGVTTGELRKMAAEGKLTGAVVQNAMIASFEKLRAEAESMPVTISGALTQLGNAWTMLIGTLDEASKGSAGIAGLIQDITGAIDILRPALAELIGLWAQGDTNQRNVAISAEGIARGMKVAVTGLIIAKNGVDVFVNALKMMGEIGLAVVEAIMDSFDALADMLPRIANRIVNPLSALTDSNLLGDMMARQAKIVEDFAKKSKVAIGGFAGAYEKEVGDVADAFEFLEKSVKPIPPALAKVDGALGNLAETTVRSEEEINKLNKAQKAMADLLGRLAGELSPLQKAYEDYNKAIRDAEAIGAKLVNLGVSQAEVEKDIATATRLATAARDDAIAALKRDADIRGQVIADLEKELALASMSAMQRQAEEIVLRAVADAQAEANRQKDQSIALDEAEQAALRETVTAYLEKIDAVNRARETLERLADQVAGDLSQAFGDFAVEALSNFDDIGDAVDNLGDALVDSIKRTVAQMISEFLKLQVLNPLLNNLFGTSLQTGGSALGSLLGGGGGASALGPGGFGPPAGLSNTFGSSMFGSSAGQWFGGNRGLSLAGNAMGFLGGAYGVFNAFRNGPGGIAGGAQGALSGAMAGTAIMPGIGTAIGAIIGGLAGLFGGRGDPRFRVADRENDARASSRLDDVIGVARDNMESGSATALANGIADFDNAIADLLDDDGLARVRDALKNWTIDVSGSAATIENVLGERFDVILDALGSDIRDFVGNAGTLEERVQRLASVLNLQSLFDGADLEGSFGEWLALAEEFQAEGEDIAATFVRITSAASMLEEATGLMGVSLELGQMAFVRFAAEVADAAGGLDRAQQLWAGFFNRFYSDSERAGMALTQARAGAQSEFADIGLNAEDFTGDGGLAEFRELFEAALPNLSAEAIVQWLEAAEALGIVLDATEAYNAAVGQSADIVTRTADQILSANAILQGVANDRAYSNMTTAERAVADVNRRFSDLRVQLNATNPTLEEAAQLERDRLQALADANEALRQQGQALVGELVWEESLVGMTEVQRAQAEINRQFDDYVSDLLDLGFAMDSVEIETVNQIRAQRLLRAETEAATEAVIGMAMSWSDIFDSLAAWTAGLREDISQFVDPGFRQWIHELTGFAPIAAQEIASRTATLQTLQQGYAAEVARLGVVRAGIQASIAAAYQASGGITTSDIYALQQQAAALDLAISQVSGSLGNALEYANLLFDQQIGALLGDLRREFGQSDPIADINARFDDLRDRATAWGATQEQLAEIEAYRAEAILRAQNGITDAIDERYEAERRWIESLRDLRDSLLLDQNLSTLTPQQRLAEAQRQYDASVSAVNAASLTATLDDDELARGAFDAAARALLTEGRAFFGSSQGYTDIFGAVLGQIDEFLADSAITLGQSVISSALNAQAGDVTPAVDVQPVVTGIDGLRADTQQGTDRIVAALARVESRVLAVETAIGVNTNAVKRAPVAMRTVG